MHLSNLSRCTISKQSLTDSPFDSFTDAFSRLMTRSTLQPLLHAQLHLLAERETEKVAAAIAQHLESQPNLRLYLHGDLGAGKTTFVRHLLRKLGVQGRIKSPTFALMETYELPELDSTSSHFDLYRLETPDEWLESGLQEDLLSPGLKLLEWPNKAGDALPPPDLAFVLQIEANAGDAPEPAPAQDEALEANDAPARTLNITAFTATGKSCADHLLKAMR